MPNLKTCKNYSKVVSFNLIFGQGFVTLLIFLDFSCIYKNDHLHMWVSLYIELVWGDLTKNCLCLRHQEPQFLPQFCLTWFAIHFIQNFILSDDLLRVNKNLFGSFSTRTSLDVIYNLVTRLSLIFIQESLFDVAKFELPLFSPFFLDTPFRHHFVCFVWYSSIWTTIDLSLDYNYQWPIDNDLHISLSFNINFTRPIKEAILCNLKVSTHPSCKFLKIFTNLKVKCWVTFLFLLCHYSILSCFHFQVAARTLCNHKVYFSRLLLMERTTDFNNGNCLDLCYCINIRFFLFHLFFFFFKLKTSLVWFQIFLLK